jgi:hypothetical protein
MGGSRIRKRRRRDREKRRKNEEEEEEDEAEEEDEDDGFSYVCAVCKDFGQLLCCERCREGFHLSCIGLSEFPEVDPWLCSTCSVDKVRVSSSCSSTPNQACKSPPRQGFRLWILLLLVATSCTVGKFGAHIVPTI